MGVSFRCRLQYNSDISKIRKFFEDTDTMYVLAGNVGIAFEAITPDNSCMYLAKVHDCDICQLYTRKHDDGPWKHGGVFRAFPSAMLINFIKAREVDDDLQITIDDDATEMVLSIVSGITTVRSVTIPLSVPDTAYEFPPVNDANVVMKVNEFKRLCQSIARAGTEVKVYSQDDAIRFEAGGSSTTHGHWGDNAPTSICYVDKAPFIRATKINIGNSRNSQVGIYLKDKYPLIFKVKLGVVDFIIYGRKAMDT